MSHNRRRSRCRSAASIHVTVVPAISSAVVNNSAKPLARLLAHPAISPHSMTVGRWPGQSPQRTRYNFREALPQLPPHCCTCRLSPRQSASPRNVARVRLQFCPRQQNLCNLAAGLPQGEICKIFEALAEDTAHCIYRFQSSCF